MRSLNEWIASQFANPRGIGGRIVSSIMNRQNSEMYVATERELRPQSQDVVLDIGCGNGTMLEMISQSCDCKLIGTDISQDALNDARHRLSDKPVELLQCPVDDIPLDDSSIDKALTINTMYFWDDLAGGLGEIKRVLKPGGSFVATHYTRQSLDTCSHTQYGYKKRSEDEVVTTAQMLGFKAELHPIMNERAYCLLCIN